MRTTDASVIPSMGDFLSIMSAAFDSFFGFIFVSPPLGPSPTELTSSGLPPTSTCTAGASSRASSRPS